MAKASFKIQVDLSKEEEIFRAFKAQVGPTQIRRGCRSCSIERDSNRPGGIRFHSVWESAECLCSYLKSDIVGTVLQLLELSAEQPEILICHKTDDVSLALLQNLRHSKNPSGMNLESDCHESCCDKLNEGEK